MDYTCKTSHIQLENLLSAMLRKSGVLIGLPFVAVGENTHTENAMICRKSSHLSVEQLILNCIGVDSCNKPAIRVKYINSCDNLVDCIQKDNAQPFRRMFAYDSTLKTFALVINQST